MKRLYRSEDDSLVAGVIGGIGEYFNIDPTLLRLIFVVFVLVTGIFPGVIAYIIAYFIIPDEPVGSAKWKVESEKKEDVIVTPPPAPKPTPESKLKDLVEEKNGKTKHEPEVKTEVVEEEPLSELKKPNWPTIDSVKSKVESEKKEEIKTEEIEYPETEPETPTLDSLLDEDYDRAADLDDVIDE